MVYGRDYEGNEYECSSCGNVTNVHLNCADCRGAACEDCSADGAHCAACAIEHCAHFNLRIVDGEDVSDDRVTRYEEITCRDCGAELVEDCKGELEVKKARRAA